MIKERRCTVSVGDYKFTLKITYRILEINWVSLSLIVTYSLAWVGSAQNLGEVNSKRTLSAWIAKQGRKQRKIGYLQRRVETLEGPKAGPSWKIRAVNGLPRWTWRKNPMKYWKTQTTNHHWIKRHAWGTWRARENQVHRLWRYKGMGISLFRVCLEALSSTCNK